MTTFLKVEDRAHGLLETTITDSGLTIVLESGKGTLFPSSGAFIITLEDERILIDSRSTDTLTVNASGRGYGSTSAAAHTAGHTVSLNILAKHLDDITTAIGTLEADVPTFVAKGDIVYASGAGAGTILTIGATDTILSVQGGVPTWRTPANILVDLSGQAGATFDFNDQIIHGGRIAVGDFVHDTVTVNGTTKTFCLSSHGDDIANRYCAYLDRASDTHSPNLVIARGRGNHATPTVVADDDILGLIGFAGWDGTDMALGALIKAEVDGTPGSDDMPTRIVFYTSADGSQSPTQRMQIDSTGLVTLAGGIVVGTTLNNHTIPAGTDTFALLAATQELTNKTLDSSVAKGTWTASGTWTIPAVTLGASVTLHRTAVAADYNPSALTTDHILAVTTTGADRSVIISDEDVASGSTDNPRIFIIKDEGGGTAANNITISLETGNIDGAADIVINADYNSISLYLDGTNGYVY